jgi:predicted MFS family arabinose efflux permease
LSGPAPGSQRSLVPLYLASGVLTLGEGSLALLAPPYLHGHGHSAAAIGTALSVYGLAALLARLPGGLLYRSHRGPWLVAVGCAMSCVAFACITLTGNIFAISALLALDGVGFSLSTTGVMAALIERRPEGSNAGSIMGWYTGTIAAGYAAAGFVGGTLGDVVGIGDAILLLALVPLVGGVLLGRALNAGAGDGVASSRGRTGFAALREFARLPGLVWLAFLVSLYINLVNGVLFTFFPIYGLAIGLSLTQVGALTGIHGTTAAVIRLASGVLFKRISYARILPFMVLLSGVAVAALSTFKVFALLALTWAVIGLTRGILRVASGALVMDFAGETDSERGAASGVYLAGLDLGKIIGPLVGGASASLVGIRTTFVVIAVAFPVAYLLTTAAVARRGRRLAYPASPPSRVSSS